MVSTIDALSPPPLPVSPAPAKGSSVPVDLPDLRLSDAAVTAAERLGPPPETRTKTPPEKKLEDAINERMERVLRTNIRMSVEVDKDTGNFVYKSIDKKTGTVDRQFPADEILRMLAFLNELDGLLFDQKA